MRSLPKVENRLIRRLLLEERKVDVHRLYFGLLNI